MPGTGSSASARSYQYLDQEANKADLRYYRLRQADVNGMVTYSPVRAVLFGRPASLLASFPNPFIDELVLHLSLPEARTAARGWLTDALAAPC